MIDTAGADVDEHFVWTRAGIVEILPAQHLRTAVLGERGG
jgi:hypothetical protein